MKKLLSIMLAACLLLGALPFAASAAETVTLKVTKTDVKADSVANSGGYGSLKVEGALDSDSSEPAIAKRPQSGLMDRNGQMLFPMRETYSRYHYSDGIVSLTAGSSPYKADEWMCRWDGGVADPVFYNLDGSEILSLSSHNEPFEIEDATLGESDISGYETSFRAAPMQGGLSVVIKKEYFNWSGGGVGGYSNQYYTYVIDETGKTVFKLPEEFEPTNDGDGPSGYTYYAKNTVGSFGEGLIAYYEHSWDGSGNLITKVLGYMDSTGKTVIDLSGRGYIDAGYFSDGMTWVVKSDGYVGYINKNGEEVISGNYSSGYIFVDGFAAVKQDGYWGVIDSHNNVIVPFSYESSFGSGDDGITTVGNGGKYGLIDSKNNVILPLEYDDISTFTDGVAYAIKDGYVYIITKDEAPAKPTVGGFSDVYEDDYYADAVMWAVENDITSGVGSGKFAPNNNCTREQIVTFLWRANGSPEPKTTANPFTDVGQSSYAYKAILWAVENDITSGTGNGKFSPGASCTRDQAVTFLWRSEGKPKDASGGGFTDVKTSDYFADAVAWAVANNITSGVGNNRFNPSGTCTRGQIVTFLYRNK